MVIFRWNTKKNGVLTRERGITFEVIIQWIAENGKIIETEHPNQEKYPNRKILKLDGDADAYLVPCVQDGNDFFFKTIIPGRKVTKYT